MADIDLLRCLEHETSKLYKFETQMDTKQIQNDLLVAKNRLLEGKSRIGKSRKLYYSRDDLQKDLEQKFQRKKKTCLVAEKNAELAVTKEKQINGPISKKCQDFQLIKGIFSENRDQRDQAQSVTGKISHVAKANLLQKETSVIAIMDDYEEKNSGIATKMQSLKTNVLNISETLSGKVKSKDEMNQAGNTTMESIEKSQMENHLKRCKSQDATDRQQQKEINFKKDEEEIQVLNEQVKNGGLDYAMKTELFENMQKENLQLNQEMQDTCAQISDLMIDWPLKIELQRSKNKLNEALYLEKNLLKQSEQYLEMTAAMENLQMETNETLNERGELEKAIATMQTLKAKMDCLQEKASKLQREVVAKQSENRFLGEQTEKARILVKKIQEKEVHRDKLSQENQKNSKELEAVTKIKAANQRRNNEIRKQICKGQENIQDMQVTHCHDDILQNMDERVRGAEKQHQEISLKLKTRQVDLQNTKNFDACLHDELRRKQEDKRKPLEKRLLALKDELASINAKVNAYGTKNTTPRMSYGSKATTPSTKASLPNPSAVTRFSPSVSAQFSPALNPDGVNKFFKNKRTPTYGQKSVSFHQDTKRSASGGNKRSSATSATGGSTKKPKATAAPKEPKTPRSASRNKKLFTASGYDVFDESP